MPDAPVGVIDQITAASSLHPGDRVRLSERSEGLVLRLIGEMAEIVEHEILGRRAVWRIQVDALVRITE
jgi:hypothetical protein